LDETGTRLRLDKWLWHARILKSRSLAARLVSDGHVRINSIRADAPSKPVKPGDVLTIALERTVRVLRVVALGTRRGPASEAQTLYEDLSPPPPPRS
jgi:ribosome-associated heat shock protein Hsp15